MSTYAAMSVIALEDDQVAPGLLGFLVVAALGVATWFLIKSMNKQIRKIDFKEREDPREQSPAESDQHDQDRRS